MAFSKRLLHRLLRQPLINRLLRALLHPLRRYLPHRALSRIPVVGEVEIALPGECRVKLRSDGYDSITARLYWQGLSGFEPESLQAFQRLATESAIVLDVGANIGLYALMAARNNPECQVYAFEPVPEVCAHLERNRAINQLDNLTVVQAAVTDQAGEVKLYIPPTEFHLPVSASLDSSFQAQAEAISVQAISLDTYIADHELSPVGVIKIDTESTEHLVIAGARDVLRRHRPVILCEVLADADHERLQRQLADHDYRFFQISAQEVKEQIDLRGGTTIHDRNYLFIPAEKREATLALLREEGT